LQALVGCAADAPVTADNPGGAVIVTPTDRGGLHGAVLPRPYRVPSVALTDTAGRQVNLGAAPASPLTLVFFGYTHCPDVCSLVLADIATALHRSDPGVRSDVSVLFITTDPARDTAPVMRSYLDRFDPAFRGLTGSMSDIRRVATALGVPLEGRRRLPGGGYEVGHGAQIIGVSPDNTASVVWTEGTPAADLAADIAVLVQGGARAQG
jgi:protein SCO1/2